MFRQFSTKYSILSRIFGRKWRRSLLNWRDEFRRLNNCGFPNNGRPPNSNRHTAPNVDSGVSSASPSSHGPHPVNFGRPNNFVRPLGVDGTNCNGNSNRLPSCRRISHLSRQDPEESRSAEESKQKIVRFEHRSTHSEQRHHREKSKQRPANLKQIDPLVKVDKQVIQNSRAGGGMISIGERSETSARSANKHKGKAFEQQKWHQCPPPVKSKSTYRSKKQVLAPAPTLCGTEPPTGTLQNRVDEQHGVAEVALQRAPRTKQELQKELAELRKRSVELKRQEDVSESAMRVLCGELNELEKRLVKWNNRFVRTHRINASLILFAEASFVGEETAQRCQ